MTEPPPDATPEICSGLRHSIARHFAHRTIVMFEATATRRITKMGPTNLIVTTTADNLHPENETRLLSLTVDESEQQTRLDRPALADEQGRTVRPARA